MSDDHDEAVHALVTSAQEGSIPLATVIRCAGRHGTCRRELGWMGDSSAGLVGQFIQSTGKRGGRFRRKPNGMTFDLLEFPGDRDITVSCPEGHGPWRLDRTRLIKAARRRTKEVNVVEVSTPHG